MPFDGTTTKGAKAVQIIDLMLELFGPNGEHWCRGAFQKEEKYCLLEALRKVNGSNGAYDKSLATIPYLESAIGDGGAIEFFNDAIGYKKAHTAYKIDYKKRIKPMLLKARELAMNDI